MHIIKKCENILHTRIQASPIPKERKSHIEGNSLFHTVVYFKKGPWINCGERSKNNVSFQTEKMKIPTIATKSIQCRMENHAEYLAERIKFNSQEEKIKSRNQKTKKVVIIKQNKEEIIRKVDLKKSIWKKGVPQPKIITVYDNKNNVLFERVARKRERENQEKIRALRIQQNRERDEIEKMKKERDELLRQIKENNKRITKEYKDAGYFLPIEERKRKYTAIDGLIIKQKKEVADLE